MPEVAEAAAKSDIEKSVAVESTESIESVTNGTSENGVSSTSSEKKSPEKGEGEILLAQGKRHLFVKDYPNAVATLGDACAALSDMYGVLADECADAYFSYGRALLELAREENNVLGTEAENEGSEEDNEADDDEEGDDPSKEGEAEAKIDGNDDNKEETKEEDDNNENEAKEENCANETIDTTKEIDEEAGNDEKDDLQLAWEVFELSKKIFERQKADARLAETYLYLGEIGLESENYKSAIEDMKRCIDIQKRILAPDHREIAETHFQLGVAHSLCNEFDEAIEHFEIACKILEMRIKNLEENGATEADKEINPFYSVEKEVAELRALIPEIKTKAADMEDFKQETIKKMISKLKEQAKCDDGAGPSSSSSVANGTTPKPASDISHLVRKKRKPEEDVSSENSIKKTCTMDVDK